MIDSLRSIKRCPDAILHFIVARIKDTNATRFSCHQKIGSEVSAQMLNTLHTCHDGIVSQASKVSDHLHMLASRCVQIARKRERIVFMEDSFFKPYILFDQPAAAQQHQPCSGAVLMICR